MNIYVSPDMEVVKLTMKDTILANPSIPEAGTSGGGMHDPGDDPLDDEGL